MKVQTAGLSGRLSRLLCEILRKLFAPHKILDDKVVLEGDDAFALGVCLGYGTDRVIDAADESVLKCSYPALRI